MFILLRFLYEHAIHPNKGSHTYHIVYYTYNCYIHIKEAICLFSLRLLYEHAIQYIQIKEAIHMFVLLMIAV